MTFCIEYDGYLDCNGYGTKSFRVNGKTFTRRVHRMVWEQAHGPIPDGMVVMHTCDNPPCIRLEHLRLGTRRENQRDMVLKGRRGSTKLKKASSNATVQPAA